MSDFYIIKNDEIIKIDGDNVDCIFEWEKSRKEWHIETEINDIHDVTISTAFLGIDHSFSHSKDHKPVLFETMIFGGKYDGYQVRYTTPGGARKGHDAAVKMVNDTSIWEKIISIPFDE